MSGHLQRLAILGASGHGKVVADAASLSGWREIVFFDDSKDKREFLCDWKIAGQTEDLLRDARLYDGVVIAIGDNQCRQDKAKQLKIAGIKLQTIIHPAAIVSRLSSIGSGSVVFAGAVINPDCLIGENCIINTNATIEHDCILGSNVHISPRVCLGGQVMVGNLTWIGIGASIKHQIRIGSKVMVGAGSVVVRDVSDEVTVVGVPARVVLR